MTGLGKRLKLQAIRRRKKKERDRLLENIRKLRDGYAWFPNKES